MTLRKKGWLVGGLSLTCLTGFATLAVRGPGPEQYVSQTPLLVALVIAALILAAIARALLLRARREAAGDPAPDVDYSHTYRLVGGFALLLVLGAAGRQLLIPAGFGKYGHYRPEAISKARAEPIRHRGENRCKKCHAKNYDIHAKGMHKPVQCEVCHGPGDRHMAQGDPKHIVRKKLSCLVCHQKLRSRPDTFPQVDVATHFKNKGIGSRGAACVSCHNPHQPLFIDQESATARVHHPVSHQCRDCHAHMPANAQKPRRHPVVFDCNYCHPDKAKALAERPHRHLGCRTCHKFSRAAKYYGYIIRFMVKNRDRRFCLLCHEKTQGRTGDKPPTIVWKSHLQQMAGNLKASCVECHQDRIHPVRKRSTPDAVPPPMSRPAAAPPGGDAPPPTHMTPTRPSGSPPSAMGAMAPAPPMTAPAVRARPRPMRPRPRRRPPRMPASHRGSADHKTCNRACHSLPASHRGRTGASCRGCHR